jgi:uncharacterized membrane protein
MSTIGAVLALSSAAGVNAYAALLALGLCVHFQLVPLSSKTALFFGEWWVLTILGALYLVEFFADKVPAVDHVWDAIHTFIRPIAGAAAAVAVVSGSGEGWVVLAALLGGATSLVFHGVKSTSRVAINAGTGGTMGWLASLVEDLFAILSSMLALFLPLLAMLLIILTILAVTFWIVRRRRPATA